MSSIMCRIVRKVTDVTMFIMDRCKTIRSPAPIEGVCGSKGWPVGLAALVEEGLSEAARDDRGEERRRKEGGWSHLHQI